MTNVILRGKPDADSLHVRVDGGEVASEKPRRGFLLNKTNVSCLLGLALASSLWADPSISLRDAQQRYPWNGKVDFTYKLEEVENIRGLKLITTVTAKGVTKASTNELESTISSGTYSGVVDCEALFGELIDPDAKLNLKLLYAPITPLPDDATGTPIDIKADLMVIDVSAGSTATTYPTYFYSDVDIGRFNCDPYKTNKIALRLINKGTFTMGSPIGEPGRGPGGSTGDTSWKTHETQHQVTLTKDFYYGIFPITQKQWHLVMGENKTKGDLKVGGLIVDPPRFAKLPNGTTTNPDADTSPIESVFYAAVRGAGVGSDIHTSLTESVDSDSFLGKLRARTGQTALDIPTEAQWEYACRAGATTATYYGSLDQNQANTTLKNYAWFSRNSKQNGTGVSSGYSKEGMTHKVGQKLPNAWGLYDTLGNVFEICRDRAVRGNHSSSNNLGSDPVTDPLVRSGEMVILRGGDWYQDWDAQRCACRSCDRGVKETNTCTGFRLGSWGIDSTSTTEVEDQIDVRLDIREVREIALGSTETFQHSSSFWGEQTEAGVATVTYVKDAAPAETLGAYADDENCEWSPSTTGTYVFTHAPGDETLYSQATFLILPAPLTALWITDHADAGAGNVHLAFQPIFGSTTLSGEELRKWVKANRQFFKAVKGVKESNLSSATMYPVSLQGSTDEQDLDTAPWARNISKGWVWVTVPFEMTHMNELLKLVIDKK